MRGEQLLVRRAPGDLLHPDPDAGVPALEFGQQGLHALALAAHGPEVQRGDLRLARVAARQQEQRQQAGEQQRG